VGSPSWRVFLVVVSALALLLLLFPPILGGVIMLVVDRSDARMALGLTEYVLIVGGTFVFTAWGLSTLVTWLLGLVAGILASTVIARERETQAWAFLRLTPLTTADILFGKYAALLHRLAGGLNLMALVRVLAVLGGVVTLALSAVTSRVTLAQVREAFAALLPFVRGEGWLFTISGVAAAGGLLSWLLEPYFVALYNGAVGLAASTFARTRGSAVLLLFAAHFILGLAVYAPVQQLLSLAMVVVVSDQTTPSPGFVILVATLPFVLNGVMQAAVMVGCIGLAYYRVDRLSE
jgi:hypothetical protein